MINTNDRNIYLKLVRFRQRLLLFQKRQQLLPKRNVTNFR